MIINSEEPQDNTSRLVLLAKLLAPQVGWHAASEIAAEFAAARDLVDLQAAEIHHLKEECRELRDENRELRERLDRLERERGVA